MRLKTYSSHTLFLNKAKLALDVHAIPFLLYTSVHTLKLNFHTITSQELKETYTYCAAIDLFVRGIHTSQSSATRLVFDCEQDRTYAALALSASTVYTVVYEDS